MLTHTNHEVMIELVTDDNGVPPLHLCPTRHIASWCSVTKWGWQLEEAKPLRYMKVCPIYQKKGFLHIFIVLIYLFEVRGTSNKTVI